MVRKRLMPLEIPENLDLKEAADLPVLNDQDQNVGKLRGICKGVGLGLIRIEPALAAKECKLSTGTIIKPYKPFWWPTPENLQKLGR